MSTVIWLDHARPSTLPGDLVAAGQ